MNIVIIGGGKMGQAFIKGLTNSNHSCFVVEQNETTREICTSICSNVYKSIDDLKSDNKSLAIDAIVIAVKPNDIVEVGNQVQKDIPITTIVISIAAGVSIETLQSVMMDFQVVRAMPNIAASQLLSATAMATTKNISIKSINIAREILETLGVVVDVDESMMDLVTAISGSGPAYFFYLAELMENVAIENGMDEVVTKILVSQTLLGAANLAKDDSFQVLRQIVTSPGGTTEKAIQVFQDNGLEDTITSGILAALNRAKELNNTTGKHS